MNVNADIIAALSSLAIPVYASVQLDTDTEYIIIDYLDERPYIYADDTDTHEITQIRLNYYTKSDPTTNKKAIRRLLRTAGFTIMSTPPEFYESDTGYHHAIVEAWIESEIND